MSFAIAKFWQRGRAEQVRFNRLNTGRSPPKQQLIPNKAAAHERDRKESAGLP
jgi:hypothetical protein